MSPETFASHLAAMRRAGFEGIGLDEAMDYVLRGKPFPGRAALITFDDGFLDNYVHAWPLLRAHGFKAVIFAVTGRIENLPLVRPTAAEAPESGDEPPSSFVAEAAWPGGPMGRRDLFFSWNEARRMEDSGIIAVEGHTHHHRSVFTSPAFDGFIRPGPRGRSFDRIEGRIAWGLPRFTLGPAMAHPAFIPSDRLLDLVRTMVPQEPDQAAAFLSGDAGPANDARLRAAVGALSTDELGRLETQDEFKARVRAELSLCRDTLERQLGRPPRALAWPWGKASPESVAIARELGFELLFTTVNGPNPPGGDPARLKRFKARDKSPAWLLPRLFVYSSPLLARLYGLVKK